MFRRVRAGTASRLTSVDHQETYGRHVLKKAIADLDVQVCVDLGCGNGDDLLIVREQNPQCRCIGVDFGSWNHKKLLAKGIEPVAVNIENSPLPFADESVDLVIANQVVEHTKEVFWINHEVFRMLKVGGHLYLGVPNVLSFHNRLLGLFGHHPTCSKAISAHVRVFSRRDTVKFYSSAAGDFAAVTGFYGSQFYPFPRMLARPLATLLPSLAFSLFFLIRKTAAYQGQFIRWPGESGLETNFFIGPA